MIKPIYLSVIVPLHNEQARLEPCLEKLIPHATRYNCEIILVDNGSTDDTWKMCKVAKSIYRPVHAIHLDERGKGLAVRTGMLAAQGRYRYMCDADLSTPAKEIHRFIEKARIYDVVIGSRELDRTFVKTTPLRRFIGRAFHKLVGSLVPGVLDTQCGFKMFRDYAAKTIFDNAAVNGMAFDVEALSLARRDGYSVYEMPVAWEHDPSSRVRLVGDSLEMLRDVLRLSVRATFEQIPAR
jgi:dolichyl-phosphate beta-glucosyltransferase